MRLPGPKSACIAAVAILALAGCGDRQKEQPVQVSGSYRALPEEAMGWRKAGPDQTYDRPTLFNYIDGGAELVSVAQPTCCTSCAVGVSPEGAGGA
ncbi:MAG: hypothetical protein FJW35_17515 [Acidobacteria bacterium]|nr:hypothetical protein [Acidobacteriota bacterium]